MREAVHSGPEDDDFSLSKGQRIAVGLLLAAGLSLVVVLLADVRDVGRHAALLVSLGAVFLLNNYLRYTRTRDFRRVRLRLNEEHKKLADARLTLQKFDDDLQMRLDQERTAQREREWLENAFRSITSRFAGTLASDRITELVVEGLGKELLVDSVICYTFDEELWPGFVKQWHRLPQLKVDDAIFPKFEKELAIMVRDLWSRGSVLTVNDAHLMDVSMRPVPQAASIAKELARSWLLAPVADGSTILGFVTVLMRNAAREWSEIEISLLKKVASEAASASVHARIFNQSMEIAAHDAEVERLVELGRVKNSFIENMNHELRTPLTSIIGYLEVIMDDVDGGEEPELVSSLTAVQRNALRLQILIENMMQISKTDFVHVPLVVTTVDVGHLLGDVVGSLQLGAEDGGVSMDLRLDSPAGDLIIDGDVNQLEQVFVNLLSNAIKFTPRDGSVTVVARHVHVDGDCVEVKVADTGIGIPAKEFPNVFQRFFRATTATQASIPGFGIGLSLVHSIVSEHNGTVTFDSTVGKGTVFTVTLPSRQRTGRKPKVTV